MKKFSLLTFIIASIVAIINLAVYVPLACTGVVNLDWLSFMFLLGYIVLAWVPFLLAVIFKKYLNKTIIISYQIFLVLSIVVGSLWKVYSMWDPYDNIVHTASGVMIALIGYWFLCNNKKNSVSLFWVFFISFSIAMMCGGVWEIWEYVTDGIIGNNAQVWQGLVGREALADTMTDIICDFCGGIVGGVCAVFLEWKSRKSTATSVSAVQENKSEDDSTDNE